MGERKDSPLVRGIRGSDYECWIVEMDVDVDLDVARAWIF
jgi:hypothetical protein